MSNFDTLLWEAAWDGDVERIKIHLTAGANINGRSVNDSCALEAAAYNGQVEACRFLLQNGANPNAYADSTGESVLHQAITKRDNPRRSQIVVALLEAGADANCRTLAGVSTSCFARDVRTRGETPLHRAAAYGDESMIEALLKSGADKSALDAHGESALTWASWHLREDSILRLLLHGEFIGTL